ncbi:MAG: iron hydrogenase small subunit [Lachnospiraceae bacterium]|nr:iron hydrogenase small subunit [Lachnospiraceae bacterium]
MVNVTINGKQYKVQDGSTILDAARSVGIHIPTLCYLKDINSIGACRVCVVEVEGCAKLVAACNNQVWEGMVVHTNSPKVRESRRNTVELILSQHDGQCATCVRSGNCTLQTIANDLGIVELPFRKKVPKFEWPMRFPLVRDARKCIKCMRCVQICDKIQGMHIWDISGTGSRTTVDVSQNRKIKESDCVLCGQCITHCPVGALREWDDTDRVMDALADPEKITVVQIAPAVRAAWGEAFGLSPEFATAKRLVAALRQMGFDYIFDTNFSADLTIMEEGSELIEKIKKAAAQEACAHADSAKQSSVESEVTGKSGETEASGKAGEPAGNPEKFPLFTSCCPGWVRFLKSQYPDMVDQLSTAKSPQQMFGAVTKSYYAQLLGVDPSRICCVSIMPCVAKKHECAIPGMNDGARVSLMEQANDSEEYPLVPDVDVVLTTREVDRLIRAEQIRPEMLSEEEFDMPLGVGSGAGVIFGATGGVMEAALRSAYYLVTGRNPDPDSFKKVRAMEAPPRSALADIPPKGRGCPRPTIGDWGQNPARADRIGHAENASRWADAMDGWKEAEFNLAGTQLKVAVVSGLGNTRKLIEALRRGDVSYHFVEVMACPGGCAGGGGQPIRDGEERAADRCDVLYGLDKINQLRYSHENPAVKQCYQDYLGAPLSHKAHELLHTDHHAWQMPQEAE